MNFISFHFRMYPKRKISMQYYLFNTPDRQAVMFSFDKDFAAESTTLRTNWYHRELF